MDDKETLEIHFTACYATLAAGGFCDSAGGQEFKRVRRWWRQCGRPRPVVPFIRWAANVALDDWPEFLD